MILSDAQVAQQFTWKFLWADGVTPPGPLQKDGGCRKPCSRQRTALVKGAIWILGPLSKVRRIRVLQQKRLDQWSSVGEANAQIVSNCFLWRTPFHRQGTVPKVFVCSLIFHSFLWKAKPRTSVDMQGDPNRFKATRGAMPPVTRFYPDLEVLLFPVLFM